MNRIRGILLSILSVFGLFCVLELYVGLENEPVKRLQLQGPPVISILSQRLHAQDSPPLWHSYVDSELYGRPVHKTEQITIPDRINFSQTTSAKFSTIEILNEKPTYRLHDVLLIRIQSRDWNNQQKQYGGDFFRSKIYQGNPYSAASEDEIIDYRNGTYLVMFTLRWFGEVKIQIKLIHPVEILPELELVLSGKIGLNWTSVGVFVSGKVSEDVSCRYTQLPAPMCNLSNTRTHGPWFCQQPKDGRLGCKDWRFHITRKESFSKLPNKLTSLSKELLTKSRMVEIKNNYTVTVQPEDNKDVNPPNLPFCNMNGVPQGLRASGHFFKDRWYPDNCALVCYNQASTMECLRNRTLVFLGDSTARQIFSLFRDDYKEYFSTISLPTGADSQNGPLETQSLEYNISMQFRFHGLPLGGVGRSVRTDFIEFVADRLNSGRDGCDVVFIISLWAHFIASGKLFYVQRLLAVKRAIQEFLDRCPDATVIVKGANTKDHPALWISLISSEWNIMQHELALREIFRDEERVGFIDAWDITKAQRHKEDLHPNKNIVREYVNIILTYLCRRREN